MSTYYVDGSVGNDGNAGNAEGAGNAWATIDHAMNTVAAGDTVYVKSSATYNELVTIDTVGTTALPVIFVGYTTTANRTDRGKVTIDGQSSRASALTDSLASVAAYYVFENFKFINGTGSGVDLTSVAQCVFRNCEFNGNGTHGFIGTNGHMFESCTFSSNGSDGLNAGIAIQVVGCWFESNTVDGIDITWGTVADSVFYDQGGVAVSFGGSNGYPCAVLGCTIDGNAKNTTTGVLFPASFWGPYILINTIVYDCITGVDGHNGGGRFIGRNNLLNNNTTDYGNAGYSTLVGEVTSAPAFSDEASQDYSLGATSPALDAGFDAYEVAGASQLADIGAIDSTASGGSGGAGPANKRAGKQ